MKRDYKIIDFLSTKNVVEVKSEAEYEKLKSKLLDSGFDIFEQKNYSEWQNLALINGRNPNVFYFEYDNAKGLTWYDNADEPTLWYGVAPLTVDELSSNEKEEIDYKEKAMRYLTIAYNAITFAQLDEMYDRERLIEEIGCTEEEYDEIMDK